jgi:hypothetical protein
MEAISFRTKIKWMGEKINGTRGFCTTPPPTLQKSGYDVKGTNGRNEGGGTHSSHTTPVSPCDNNTNHITHVHKTSTQPYKFIVGYIL